jgi:ABC-2 type transport system ATP-binding protein
MAPAIEAHHLTRRFGARTAVEDLDLEVARGEAFVLLGPNGAGKTTTVRVLCCLLAPSAGSARVLGHDVVREGERIRGRIGLLTESPGLYDRLSARQNLDYYARLYGVAGAERDSQVERYLRMLGLWERRDDRAGSFSKGMQQKLSIARALVHEPKVMFLDEPTSALDPESARTVRDFIGEVRSQGRTIVLCTHNLDEADRLCDRIAIVKQRLIRVDSPSRLRSDLYGRRIDIRLKAVTEPVLAALRALDFVGQLEAKDNHLVMNLQSPEEQNPIVVRRIVEAGGDIQFVEERHHSLEEVYMALVRGEVGA